MLDAGTKAEFDQQFRAVQVLYFAMLASLAGYLVIGLMLGSARVAATVTSPSSTTFYLLSLGLAAAAFFVKEQMVRPVLPGSSPAEIKESLGSFRSGHLVSYVLCEGVVWSALSRSFWVASASSSLTFWS